MPLAVWVQKKINKRIKNEGYPNVISEFICKAIETSAEELEVEKRKKIDYYIFDKKRGLIFQQICVGDYVISDNDCGAVIQVTKKIIVVKFNLYVETFYTFDLKQENCIWKVKKQEKSIKSDSILYGCLPGHYGANQ